MLWYKESIRFDRPLKSVTVSGWKEPEVPQSQMDSAVEEAFQKGKEEATQFFESQLAEMRQEVVTYQTELLDKIESEVEDTVTEAINRVPQLVFALTEQVLKGVELDGENLEKLIQPLIQEFSHHEGERLEVFLSETDFNTYDEYRKEGKSIVRDRVSFQKDPELKSKDCLIRSRFGLLDARLDTKVSKIRSEFDL